jgi:molecular chaperone Hsp33
MIFVLAPFNLKFDINKFMKNKDKLQRFLFDKVPIRGELIHLNESFKEIIQQHKYAPIVQNLLGQALVLVCLLSGIVKFKGRITLQFQSKGKLKLLLAQCNQDLQMRGLVQVNQDVTEAEILEDFQNGVLVIMMDPDAKAGQRYQGIVAWQGNSLAQSIEGYFNHSEQLPTRIWLAVDEEQASALLLQKMPNHDVNITEAFHENEWEHIVHLAQTVKPTELLKLENEVLLHRLFVEEDIRMFEPTKAEFRCTCSVKRSENAILLLGKEEAEEELRDNQVIVVTCEFCNKEFTFDRVDVTSIFLNSGNPPSSNELH